MQQLGRLAFIGGGNMTAALIGGLTKQGADRGRIMVADPNGERLEHLRQEYGIGVATANAAAIDGAEAVVLAVKPEHMRAVTLELAPHLQSTLPLVISVAAGIPHAALEQWLGTCRIPVVRAMPNRPALIGWGATGLNAAPGVGPRERALAESIMAAVGLTVWVSQESQMDTVTALSGSGPAYFFMFMEALEKAAAARGLPLEVAHALTLATAHGAAQMARMSTESLAVLREQVTSKGGTTAAALRVLDAADLHGIVAAAVAAADQRAAQLALEHGVSLRGSLTST